MIDKFVRLLEDMALCIINLFSPQNLFLNSEPALQDCGDVHLEDGQARPRKGAHGGSRYFHR